MPRRDAEYGSDKKEEGQAESQAGGLCGKFPEAESEAAFEVESKRLANGGGEKRLEGGVDSSGVGENGRREVLGEDLAEVAD